jgi:hypothetical protein
MTGPGCKSEKNGELACGTENMARIMLIVKI